MLGQEPGAEHAKETVKTTKRCLQKRELQKGATEQISSKLTRQLVCSSEVE